MTNPNIRRPKESQEAYRKRLREMHAGTKGGSPRMLWPSSSLGTYRRAAHGPLDENTGARVTLATQRLFEKLNGKR